MSATTPLLLLLDSILSGKPERIQQAKVEISQVLEGAGLHKDPRFVSFTSATNSHASSLIHDIDLLLLAFPNLASVPSTHDKSLPLHFAASTGNVAVARRLWQQYPKAATTSNSKGKIPLHYAAREGRNDMVAFFLQTTPQTATITSKKQKLALHFAAGDGHTEVVRQLLRVHPKGASLPSAKGKLPLHFAARWGHVQIASDLLFVYPDGIRCLDGEGSLSLHDAAREGQVQISKFLIERYPVGLCTANIRGEIPLFPAVRSGNLDLVILYLQGWPAGGKEILKSASADDNVEHWDWSIIELCLRGAVNNFSDCPLMEGKEAPAVCCPIQNHVCGIPDAIVADYTSSPSSSSAQRLSNPYFNSQVDHYQYVNSIPQSTNASNDQPPSAACPLSCAKMGEDVPRSKSPILENDGSNRSKKRSASCGGNGGGKRSRSGSDYSTSPSEHATHQAPLTRKFYALHAAFASGASSHVLRRVAAKFPEQLSEADEWGRLPLHWAVQHEGICEQATESAINNLSESSTSEKAMDKEANEEEEEDAKQVVQLVVDEVMKAHPGAAFVSDASERLPLHLALAARADFRVIQELVKANPASGVDPITFNYQSPFFNKPPIYMATEYDCDLSTTYMLLRGDPSVVSSRKRPAAVASAVSKLRGSSNAVNAVNASVNPSLPIDA